MDERKYYYGLVDTTNKKYGYGFVLEDDSRRTDDFIEVSEKEHKELFEKQNEGLDIVCFDRKVFNAPQGEYYTDDNGVWHKKDKSEFIREQALNKAQNLINEIYLIKANKAYCGVIINDMLVFETNQTSITNTVASLALMSDTATANWKFYTVGGEPYVQQVSKLQLAGIAQFGQNMINECFAVEGQANENLQTATIEQLNDEVWRNDFINGVQAEMDKVNNKLTVSFE